MAYRSGHLALLVTLLAVTSSAENQSRWSRQISSYTADISDWVPLKGPVQRDAEPIPQPTPIKRQAIAEPRILSEPYTAFTRSTFNQEPFPSRTYFNSPANRQLYLQSVPAVPSAPQNYLSDQGFGQSIRFGLAQPNFPLNQGFVAPQYSFENAPAASPPVKTRPLNAPFKYDTFSKSIVPLPPQPKPFINKPLKTNSAAPKFVDGYRVENSSTDFGFNLRKKPQSLQKLKYDGLDNIPRTETLGLKPKVEREEVQLLYVPVESLSKGQFRNPLTTTQFSNADAYTQGFPKQNPLKHTLQSEFQRPLSKPVENFSSSQDYYSNQNLPINSLKPIDQIPKFSTMPTPFPTAPPTTPKPKKLKPHQPPLAVFLAQEAKKGNQVKVGDVLYSLKSAQTIAVLDAVNPSAAPKVFIGPNSLTPPENYVKFELPYLSNIENIEKKLRQLPFFVAPLSYKTPDGFAKIPFPSPHVGSVVINAQIATSPPTPAADVYPNSYLTSPSSYKEDKTVTQKPVVSFYSTSAPRTQPGAHAPSNYYSFEPQSVNTIRPSKGQDQSLITSPPRPDAYYIDHQRNQYNQPQIVRFPQNQNYPAPDKIYQSSRQTDPPTTAKTTVSTTATKLASTYPSQLLETHNPYSINQAFHLSTPLDYQNYFDEYKENVATPGYSSSVAPSSTSSTNVPSPTPSTRIQEEIISEKQTYQPQQTSTNYLQNYSPEIQYESEIHKQRYPNYQNEYTTKTEQSSNGEQSGENISTINNAYTVTNTNPQTEYSLEQQTYVQENLNDYKHIDGNNAGIQITSSDGDIQSSRIPNTYNQYEVSNQAYENKDTTSSTTTSTTTTTTTKRAPLRTRGRPKYTTTPRTDSGESTSRPIVTRKPARERRPLPTRSRYEPNKITTERPTRKPVDSSESTTKSSLSTGSRAKTRGRVHYKPSENDEYYDKKNKDETKGDLAYQRDVLHQNYPVTLMERMSTVDIEAITEPSLRISSTKQLETGTEVYDAENAYTNERFSISPHYKSINQKEGQTYITPKPDGQSEETYTSKPLPTLSDEQMYHSRSSAAPADSIPAYDEKEKVDYGNANEYPPSQRPDRYTYEPFSVVTEENSPVYLASKETYQQEDTTTTPNIEITKAVSQEVSTDSEPEYNVVQTTPSYNRVRVRPGVVRQYHQASSTESSRTKTERRKPAQAVTYRPAFERRRTTMRIEEIEADLKTKPVHSRAEAQDHRHPVYRPEPTIDPATTSPASYQESTTKRNHFRRRRPSYSTTTTETSSYGTTKRTYEVKNRFRGRRPTTEKSTDKPESQTEVSSSTVRSVSYNRYSNRPRLSERYNKKPETEEDQDGNHSINIPKYVTLESDQWSPKISADSFKPFNPNEISEESKLATTERRSDRIEEGELDIITARNDYDEILVSVTPPSNNRNNKKIPDIPPTLEALVEQSKVTTDSKEAMSTFETMLEEVMKSLEEQDENEYTPNVMKHKGGEIGEIPPAKIISLGDNETAKATTVAEEHTTTVEPTGDDDTADLNEEDGYGKARRRGFWKKVKVRPVSTESIEVAESQYYSQTVNQLGQSIKSKNIHEKPEREEKPKLSVTTYKPSFQFLEDIFRADTEGLAEDEIPNIELTKIDTKNVESIAKYDNESVSRNSTLSSEVVKPSTEFSLQKETPTEKNEFYNPAEIDLGTGSPDPTQEYTSPTEPVPTETVDRSDEFSLMDYLFGITSQDNFEAKLEKDNLKENRTISLEIDSSTTKNIEEKGKFTTESSYIPDEITTVASSEGTTEIVLKDIEINNIAENLQKQNLLDIETTTKSDTKIETSSVSSFMDSLNVMSTSMSTEISHETEICFRGKCIKTNKDVL